MQKKGEYEFAKIELIYFDANDVISTSGESSGNPTNEPMGDTFWSNNGWT